LSRFLLHKSKAICRVRFDYFQSRILTVPPYDLFGREQNAATRCWFFLEKNRARYHALIGWHFRAVATERFLRRDATGVRLFTANGHAWTGRFPLIARAALSLKAASCLIDGEAD